MYIGLCNSLLNGKTTAKIILIQNVLDKEVTYRKANFVALLISTNFLGIWYFGILLSEVSLKWWLVHIKALFCLLIL